MKAKHLTMAVFLLLTALCNGQMSNQDKPGSKWVKFDWLIGTWMGEGSGQPGQGGGLFTFAYDLGSNVIVRKNHTEFPATATRPASVHDDLLIIYSDPGSAEPKGIYFDNEGHTINYSVSFLDKSVVFTSLKVGKNPAFRLTYTPLEKDKVDISFDMSQDGVKFVTYLEGKSVRTK